MKNRKSSFQILILFSALAIWGCRGHKDDVQPTPKVQPPAITKISTRSGQAQTTVKISGTGFASSNTVVEFNGVSATITTISDTAISVLAPAGSSKGPVVVKVNGQTATGPVFTYYKIVAYGSINYVPTYWVDGVATIIPSSAPSVPSQINKLVISGTDVYAIGIEYTNTSLLAKFWKNSVAIQIDDTTGYTQFKDLVVSGSDVYLCGQRKIPGTVNSIAKYWKNGTVVPLQDGSGIANATGIAISGSDMYVSGNDYPSAAYWKNGVEAILSPGLIYNLASGIAISGQDVYIAGTVGVSAFSKATYWKNGVVNFLTDGSKAGSAYALAFSGPDIYVCGSESKVFGGTPVAKYWKNGVPVSLSDGTRNSYATSISVVGDDVITMVLQEPNPPVRPIASYVYKNAALVSPFIGTDPTLWLSGAFAVSY